MEQQLYGSTGEAPGLIIIAAPTTHALCFSGRQDEDGMGCYGEYVGEYIGNLGNILGTH
jgi:hypothetical protein